MQASTILHTLVLRPLYIIIMKTVQSYLTTIFAALIHTITMKYEQTVIMNHKCALNQSVVYSFPIHRKQVNSDLLPFGLIYILRHMCITCFPFCLTYLSQKSESTESCQNVGEYQKYKKVTMVTSVI